ncbi:MAG: hypothetical protein WC241_04405 [Candidatus Paceibacterota bacterium]
MLIMFIFAVTTTLASEQNLTTKRATEISILSVNDMAAPAACCATTVTFTDVMIPSDMFTQAKQDGTIVVTMDKELAKVKNLVVQTELKKTNEITVNSKAGQENAKNETVDLMRQNLSEQSTSVKNATNFTLAVASIFTTPTYSAQLAVMSDVTSITTTTSTAGVIEAVTNQIISQRVCG